MTTRPSLADRHKALILIVVLLLVYGLLVFVVLPRHVFFSGDEGAKAVLVASSVRAGNWWRVAFAYPGLDVDPEVEAFFSPWMRVVDGRLVPFHLSTMSFWNAPLYALLGLDGLYLLPLLAGVGVSWLAYRLARLIELPHPWAMVPLVGLCTPVFFYSLLTWDHTPTVFYSTLTVYLVARQAYRRNRWEMVAVGVLMGLALWTRLETYLFVPAALLAYLYVFRRQTGVWSSLIPIGLGLAATVVGMVAQHVAVYGEFSLIAWSARTAREIAEGPSAPWLVPVRSWIFQQANVLLALTVDGSKFWLERVFLALAFAATVLIFRLPRLQRFPLLSMGGALMQVIGTALTLLHARMEVVVGLIATLPLAAPGLAHVSMRGEKDTSPPRLALEWVATLSVLFLLMCLVLLPNFGGLSWGPRYMSALFPLLPVLAWATLWRVRSGLDSKQGRQAVQIAFGLLVVASLVVQCVGVGILYEKKARMVIWHDNLDALDAEFVLSDQPFYLQETASLYFERVFLSPRTQDVYDRLLGRMYDQGFRRFIWVSSETSEIDPLFKTTEFSVRQVQGNLYEMAPS